MEIKTLLKLSPTLLECMLQAHVNEIKKGCKAFRDDDNLILELQYTSLNDGGKIRLYFDTIPPEIRQAIHDYTTRLISEKLLIEQAIKICKKETAA